MLCFDACAVAGAAVLLALSAASPSARAQSTLSPDEQPRPGEYQPLPVKQDEPDVQIDLSPSKAGLSYTVRSEQPRPEQLPDSCDGSCTLYLAPGEYDFQLFDHGHAAGSGTVHVKRDAVWQVKPQNRALEWVGLGAFVTGVGAAATGLVLLNLSLFDQMREGPPPDSHRFYVLGGLGLGAAGAVLIPLGWHWFWSNRSPVYESRKIRKDAWARRLRVGAAPAPGGASVAASWTF